MGKSGRRPRQRMNARQHENSTSTPKKKEQDWSFEDIVRSKTPRR